MLRDDLTVLECRMTGLEFGAEFAQKPREKFEEALSKQLVTLGERLAITDRNVEEPLPPSIRLHGTLGKPYATHHKRHPVMAEYDDDGYEWPAPDAPHPEVRRRASYTDIWPADKLFPLTPMEAWYLLQGWEIAPAAGITGAQVLEIPAKAEGGDGWIVLWRP